MARRPLLSPPARAANATPPAKKSGVRSPAPRKPGADKAERRSKRPRGLKHALKTGLLPGISEEQFWDPGSAQRKRARKRSAK